MRRFVLAMLAMPVFPAVALAQNDTTAPPAMTAPGTAGPDASAPAGPGGPHQGGMMKTLQAKFAAANTTHDGHLTLAQAETAGFKPVVANFSAIDTARRGYVTLNDIEAWRMEQMAQKLEQRAAALRAQD
jgi:hypothetical protein